MASAPAAVVDRPMTPEEKKVIFASSLGTVFEWYDFYLYGSLAFSLCWHSLPAFWYAPSAPLFLVV
jgi:hypothetical protein